MVQARAPHPTRHRGASMDPHLESQGVRAAVLWSDRAPRHKLISKNLTLEKLSCSAPKWLYLPSWGATLHPCVWMNSTPFSDCPSGGSHAPVGRQRMLSMEVMSLSRPFYRGENWGPRSKTPHAPGPIAHPAQAASQSSSWDPQPELFFSAKEQGQMNPSLVLDFPLNSSY